MALSALLKEPGWHNIHSREEKLANVPGEQEKGYMKRILWLEVSATITLPEVSTATPPGLLKSAAVPTPLAEPPKLPDVLPPASVMTVRLG